MSANSQNRAEMELEVMLGVYDVLCKSLVGFEVGEIQQAVDSYNLLNAGNEAKLEIRLLSKGQAYDVDPSIYSPTATRLNIVMDGGKSVEAFRG